MTFCSSRSRIVSFVRRYSWEWQLMLNVALNRERRVCKYCSRRTCSQTAPFFFFFVIKILKNMNDPCRSLAQRWFTVVSSVIATCTISKDTIILSFFSFHLFFNSRYAKCIDNCCLVLCAQFSYSLWNDKQFFSPQILEIFVCVILPLAYLPSQWSHLEPSDQSQRRHKNAKSLH